MPARRRPPGVVLLDTNVVLDVLLAREPFVGHAALVLDAIGERRLRGFVAGHAVTTVHHLVERARGRATATAAVSDLLDVLDVVPTGAAEFRRALTLGLRDFEDAVQVVACLAAGADHLVTRNGRDFRGAPVSILTPEELVAVLTTT